MKISIIRNSFLIGGLTLLFLILWIAGSVLYLFLRDGTLISLTDSYSYQQLNFPESTAILIGEKISGQFEARANFLGSVSVGISGFYRKTPDHLNFVIRDLDHEDVLIKSSYELPAFSSGNLREFGFPPIHNSMSNKYYFEITPTLSKVGDMVMLDAVYPALVIKYQFPQSYLLSSIWNLGDFTIHKLNTLATDRDFLVNSFMFSIPLLMLFTMLLSRCFRLISFPILVVLSLVIFDLLGKDNRLNLYYLFVLASWITLVLYFRLEARISGLITLGLFLVCTYALNGKIDPITSRSGVWTYAFFLTFIAGEVHQMYSKSVRYTTLTQLANSTARFFKTIGVLLFEAARAPADLSFRKSKDIRQFVFQKRQISFKFIFILLLPIRFIVLHWRFFLRLFLASLLVYVIWHLLNQNYNYIHFYLDFFPKSALKFYFQYSGFKLLAVDLFAIPVLWFVFVTKRNKINSLLLLSIIILILNQKITDKVFDITTTDFRNKIYIWDYQPSLATLWDNITIIGRNFNNRPFIGKVEIGQIEHRILSWSDRKIIISADPTKTKSGELIIIRSDGAKSDPVDFEYH